MAALVGTIGTVVVSTAGNSSSPAFGASETRVAGNLLICWVTVTGTATLPSTPAGWYIGKQVAGTSTSSTIYYRNAAGSDTAPVIAGIASGIIAAQLGEFSATTSTIDQTGSNTGTTSPNTATAGGANAATAELIVMGAADRRSANRATNDTWTSNDGAVTLGGSNNGVSIGDHYSFGYIASSSATTAQTSVVTLSITTSITGIANVNASFLKGVGTFLGYGQAQADIKVSGINKFAQAQAKINTTRNYAQAQSRIDTGVYSASDTFTRTVNPNWGTADTGGAWGSASLTSTYLSTNGTQGVVDYTNSPNLTQIYSWLQGVTTKKIVQYKLDFIQHTVTALANHPIEYFFHVNTNGVGGSEWGAHLIVATNTLAYTFTGYSAGNDSTGTISGTLSLDTTYHIIIQVIAPANVSDSTQIRAKFYTGSEPDGWTIDESLATNAPFLLNQYPAVEISADRNYTTYFDNFIFDPIDWTQYGQAQAKIATTRQFAQSQSDIKTTYNQFAQSQTDIKVTNATFAQTQAQIIRLVVGQAQAQARIGPTTYERILRGISGLQSFWTLGESSGSTAISDYVGAIGGTINGTPTFGVASDNPLQLESGIKTNANTDYLSFGDNYDITGDWSLIAWVKHTGALGLSDENIFSKESANAVGFRIVANNTTTNFYRNGGGPQQVGILADTWHLIGVVNDASSTATVYHLDAKKYLSANSPRAVTDTAIDLTFGKSAYTTSNSWNGAIGSVAILSTKISFDDFQALYTVAKSGAIVRPGQAQAFIIKAKGLGQAAALINGTYFLPFLDTFTRSVTDGLGTSDNGDTWTYQGSFPAANYDVNGTAATIITSSTFGASAVLLRTLILADQGIEISGQVSIDKLPTDTSLSLNFGLANTPNSTPSFTVPISGLLSATQTNLLLGNSSIVYTLNDVYNFKLHHYTSSGGSWSRTKLWKDGDAEPGWATATSGPLATYIGYPKVTAGINSNTNAPSTWTLNFLQILSANITHHGQAQAQIITVNPRFAQAQAKISTTRNFGQANATIVLTQSTHPIADEANNGWVGVST